MFDAVSTAVTLLWKPPTNEHEKGSREAKGFQPVTSMETGHARAFTKTLSAIVSKFSHCCPDSG